VRAATLDHVTITASDFERSLAFYAAALGALGLVQVRELVDEEEDAAAVDAVAWGAEAGSGAASAAVSGIGLGGGHGVLWLVRGSRSTQGLHIRLWANARQEVEAFFQAGVEAGGSAELAPRRWTPYRRGEFQAIVADPDGNLIEACCPE
jgi:catechol 2,3-dioxygenase-like lactoylglutathione lyase family enzyme